LLGGSNWVMQNWFQMPLGLLHDEFSYLAVKFSLIGLDQYYEFNQSKALLPRNDIFCWSVFRMTKIQYES